MKHIRLVYYSRASREMSLADLKNILETARKNNAELDISGMLCYENQYFLQALEGDRETVNELYLDIADDPRHDEIAIISYEETPDKLFAEWLMGYAGSSSEFKQLLEKLGQTEFKPSELSIEDASQFLKNMSEHQIDI